MITEQRPIEMGTITEVHIKDDAREIGVTVECGPSQVYGRQAPIPFYPESKFEWTVPREGDEVEVYQIGRNSYAARKPRFPPRQRSKSWHKEHERDVEKPADILEDDRCYRFEDGSEIFVRRELDGGEAKRSLYIRMSGDIVLQAGGEFIKEAGVDPESDPEYFPEDRSREQFD